MNMDKMQDSLERLGEKNKEDLRKRMLDEIEQSKKEAEAMVRAKYKPLLEDPPEVWKDFVKQLRN